MNPPSDNHQTPPSFSTVASIIISIYKDVEALECIFVALEGQSERNFEVIVSEDGEDPKVADYIAANRHRFAHLQHLCQEDSGFRKNRALNRAVAAARSDYLIFIDGDCVPQRRFVENHVRQAARGTVNAGRRVNLGPQFSRQVRDRPNQPWLNDNLPYLLKAFALRQDHVEHYEEGLVSPLLHNLLKRRRIALLGCNFSCFRDDLIGVNGFDEQYQSPGIGEDVDLEYRLRESGCQLRSIKLLGNVFHLHHASGYRVSDVNRAILAKTRKERILRPQAGISQYL